MTTRGPERHRLSDVDHETKTATCSVCGPNSPIRVSHGGSRRTCMTKRRSESRGNPITARLGAARRRRSEKRYVLSASELEAMFAEQGGRCGICDREGSLVRSSGLPVLAVDHDHATGAIRQLLCTRCNTRLGVIEVDIDAVYASIAYLERHAAPKADSVLICPA